MEPYTREAKCILPTRFAARPDVTQQVGHRHRGQERGVDQRESAEGADLLLELVGEARVYRVVAAVVRTRCHLVDVQPAAVGNEELHAQNPYVVHRLRDADSEALRAARQIGTDPGRDHRRVQNPVHVMIFGYGESRRRPVTPSREYH